MITQILDSALSFYALLIFVYVILSWFPVGSGGVITDIYRVLASVCEPYIGIFRRIVPLAGGGIDFSPLVALLVLRFVIQGMLLPLLRQTGL